MRIGRCYVWLIGVVGLCASAMLVFLPARIQARAFAALLVGGVGVAALAASVSSRWHSL